MAHIGLVCGHKLDKGDGQRGNGARFFDLEVLPAYWEIETIFIRKPCAACSRAGLFLF